MALTFLSCSVNRVYMCSNANISDESVNRVFVQFYIFYVCARILQHFKNHQVPSHCSNSLQISNILIITNNHKN